MLEVFSGINRVVLNPRAALVGATTGGQIAKEVAGDTEPESQDGFPLSVGDFVTLRGPMEQLNTDNGANVIWWVEQDEVILSGQASALMQSAPFSYCDVDDEFTEDGCD